MAKKVKNIIRFQAAIQVVGPAVQRAIQGKPLPQASDPEFEKFATACASVVHREELGWLGKSVMIVVAQHVAEELKKQRESGAT